MIFAVLYALSSVKAWRGHGVSLAPTKSINPTAKSIDAYPCVHTPISHSLSFTKSSNDPVVTLVSRLGSLIRPSAIPWSVVSINVDSVYGKVWRAVAHVFHEVIVAMKPSITHLYSPVAVMLRGCVVLVRASFSNPAPNFVRFCTAFAVRGVFGYCGVATVTAARCSVTSSEMPGGNYSAIPAVAKAQPMCATVVGFMVLDSRKFSVPLAAKVVECARHFRHLEKFTIERVWQAVVKPLFGSYPSHGAYCSRGVA